MNARGQDTRRAVEYAMPWVRRRLTARSSGDDVPPKRPELMPLDALGRFHGPGASESGQVHFFPERTWLRAISRAGRANR